LEETATPSDLTRAALREQLRGDLADYKLPKTVTVLDSLPRTASGTVDRNALRTRLESERRDRPP
ncbi:MAG: AMP-binding enzyme, partial [Halodesulfurarchaeum sp.]